MTWPHCTVTLQKCNYILGIGGYIVKKLSKKLSCETCYQAMISTNANVSGDHHYLILSKDRGGLIYPSEDVFKILVSGYDFQDPKIMQKLKVKFASKVEKHSPTGITFWFVFWFRLWFQQRNGCRISPFLPNNKRNHWYLYENSALQICWYGHTLQKWQLKKVECETEQSSIIPRFIIDSSILTKNIIFPSYKTAISIPTRLKTFLMAIIYVCVCVGANIYK